MIVIATPHKRYDCLERVLEAEGIEHVRIRSLDDLAPAQLKRLNPRYVFFPHWSWKIPAEIHENFECVIFHMTDLPFGRGGSPLQNLIVQGFHETRVSALRCVTEMDAGPVYMKEPLSLLGTAEEILMRATTLMSMMMLDIIRKNPVPAQQEGEATLFKRRRPEDGNIATLNELERIFDFIRMLDGDGYPSAYIETDSFRFEFSRASLKPGEIRADVRIVRKPA
jgi:methionyl-tRNA formyltransferase